MSLSQQRANVYLPTKIIFGVGCVQKSLLKRVKGYKKSNIFLATDSGLVKAGIVDSVKKLLEANEINVVAFSDVEPNPHAETVMKGAALYKQEKCDMILAIGGGSPMDFAKAVGTIVQHPGHILDYRVGKERIVHDPPLFFAIPTTVGTGAEVTPVAVITDHEAGRKYIIASTNLAPSIAFIDPSLTTSLPRNIVASTGIDALVHAIEAYTSVNANPISDGLALQAIRMLQEHLPPTYAQPNNMEARSQVHFASTIAGMAFGIAGVGLVHSCSHPMSAIYHVPHGLANAILLPHVLKHNVIANYKKFAHIATIFEPTLVLESDINAANELIHLIERFNQSLDIPKDFSYLKKMFTAEMIDRLVQDAMEDQGTIPNNPRKVRIDDVRSIYEKVLPIYQTEGEETHVH